MGQRGCNVSMALRVGDIKKVVKVHIESRNKDDLVVKWT